MNARNGGNLDGDLSQIKDNSRTINEEDVGSDVEFGVSGPMSMKRQHISQDPKEQNEAD